MGAFADVDSGNTVMDYLPPERERGITISSAAISLPWSECILNLVDTPGHADFTFEVERTLKVLDGAVVLLDAASGVEVGSNAFDKHSGFVLGFLALRLRLWQFGVKLSPAKYPVLLL